MAIGSAPEIGTTFTQVTEGFDWKAWREYVGDDLMGGYGTVHTPDPVRMARFHEEALDGAFVEA